MTKTFCDICKAEITKDDNEYELTCLKLDKDKHQYDIAYRSDNVCEECINSINNFISNRLEEKSCTNCLYYSQHHICTVGHLCLGASEWCPKGKKDGD